MWYDAERSLKHKMHAYHDLQPPMQSEAAGLKATVRALAPVISAAANSRSNDRKVPVIAVMSNGQLWRWSVPLPPLPRRLAGGITPQHDLSRGAFLPPTLVLALAWCNHWHCRRGRASV